MPSVKDLVRRYESKGLLSDRQRSPQKLKTSARLPLQHTGNKLSPMPVKADGLAVTVYRKMAELRGDGNVTHVPDYTTREDTPAVDSSMISAVGGLFSDSFARSNSKESVDNSKNIQPSSLGYQATKNDGFGSYINMSCFKGGIKSRSESLTSDKTYTEASERKRYDRTIYDYKYVCSTQPRSVEQSFRGSNKNIAYLVGSSDTLAKRISNQKDTLERTTNRSAQGNESTKVRGEVQLSGELEERAIQIEKPKCSNCGWESGTSSLYRLETPDPSRSDKDINTSFERKEQYHRATTLRQCQDCHHSSDAQIEATYIAPTRSSSGVTGSVVSLPDAGDNEGHNIGRHTDERQMWTTKRYVEEVHARSQLPSRMKYPSEPTVRKLSESSRTRTQENVFNIHRSHVSILSSENGSASSLVSSEEERIRESITDYTKDSLLAHQQVLKHQCFMKAKKVLDDEGVIFIVENNGSGATHLAWDLLSLDNSTEKYNILDVNDFHVCIRSKESKIILVDEAFGSSKLDEHVLDRWLKHAAMCTKNKHTRMVKIIFTVKHHIASQCKQKLQDYHKNTVDLEDPKIQRDSDEMVELMKAMIKDNEDELKVILTGYTTTTSKPQSSPKCYTYISEQLLTEIAEVASPSGFPKRCKQFLEARNNIKEGVAYFTRPTEELLDEMIGMKTSKNLSDLDKFLTLVMTIVLGDKLTLDKVSSIDHNRQKGMKKPGKKKKKMKRTSKLKDENTEPSIEIPWWIQVINRYATHSATSLLEAVKNGLHLLRGNFLKEDIKDVFCFVAPCVKNAVLILCGQEFPQYILKLCDELFFQAYIGSVRSFEIGEKQCINIDVSDEVVCGVANEMLLDIHANGDVETFAKHRLFSDPRFIQQFIVSFGKDHDQLWKLITDIDKTTGRCLVSCALENEHVQSHFSITSNLAYSILLHPIWTQKRKKHPIWTAKTELNVLKCCCIRGHKDIYFELRKKHNIPVDYDCLRLAIESGTCAVVEEILHFIGTKMADEEKCKAMERALLKYTNKPLRSRHTVVDLLSKFVPIDYKVSGAEPFIHFATKSNDARMIVTLKVFEGDINVTNSNGKTCLLEAVQRNKGPFLSMALRHGADQRKSDSRRGFLPIHEATKENNPYIMGLLVEADNDITMATDSSGRQPLHIAAQHNSFQAAQFLIDHGVEVDAYDDEKNTPLHYSASSGKANVMHCLLEASADVHKLDKEGNSTLLVACQTGNVKGVKRLLRCRVDMERDGCQYDCFFAAIEANHVDILKLLIQHGFDITKTNQDGNTALHIATERCYMKLVHYILNQSDNMLGMRNRKGEVPLHIASRNGNLVLVRTLLQHGSERSPINRSGSTPLHLVEDKLKQLEEAGSFSEYENYYCLLLLLQKSSYRMSMETAV